MPEPRGFTPSGRSITAKRWGEGGDAIPTGISTPVDRRFNVPLLFGRAESGLPPGPRARVAMSPWRAGPVMKQISSIPARRVRRRLVLVPVSALLCAGTLAGCSSVPDAVNPVEWYRGTRDWVTGADKPAEPAAARPSTAEGKDFPALDSVPSRPAPPSAAERRQLARSLAADREDARYSDEVIRRQTDASGGMSDSGTSPPAPPRQQAMAPLAAEPPAAQRESGRAMPPPPELPPPPVPQQSARPPSPSPGMAAPEPFPPMPTAPPAPPQTGIEVPPLPAAPPDAPPMPAPRAMAPPAPQPPMTPPPMVEPSGGTETPMQAPMQSPPVFGEVPPDIALNFTRPAPRPAPSVSSAPAGRRSGQGLIPAAPGAPGRPAPAAPARQNFALATEQPLATIRFGIGSSEVTGNAHATIRRTARTIARNRVRVRVVGHASSRTRDMDPVSHHMANFQISLDRANAVARELRRAGVDPALITVQAVSDSQPAYFEVMPAGEAANRRVVILVDR